MGTQISRRRFMAGTASAAVLGFPAIVRAKPASAIGLSLPLSGVQSEVGKEMEMAYRIAMEAAGDPYKLIIRDDASLAENTAENYRSFAGDASIIAGSGIVGTPHTKLVEPIASAAGLPLIGIRSGATEFRNSTNTIWHLRSSYDDEIAYIAREVHARGQSNIAVIYSADAFGEGARKVLLQEMKRLGMEELVAVPANRNGGEIAVTEAADKLAAVCKGRQDVTSIVLLMITKPMIEACKHLRLVHKMVNPAYAMSFTANLSVVNAPDVGLRGLGVVTAFPIPRFSIAAGAKQFRQDLERSKHTEMMDSLTGYEAWFYGRTIAAIDAAESRKQMSGNLQKRIEIPNVQTIAFDSKRVGYRHLGIAYKAANGRLKEL